MDVGHLANKRLDSHEFLLEATDVVCRVTHVVRDPIIVTVARKLHLKTTFILLCSTPRTPQIRAGGGDSRKGHPSNLPLAMDPSPCLKLPRSTSAAGSIVGS